MSVKKPLKPRFFNPISEKLLQWFDANKRSMPWRGSKNPYVIWLSEIILQQTQVIQGTPYFIRFIEAFPTVHHLAAADENDVLKLWQGLGYYSRARNLLKTANYVSKELNGKFPENSNLLLMLKGVGAYTAAAIASIAFDEPVPVIDGNVNRVITRLFEISTPIDSNSGKIEIKNLAESLLDHEQPGIFNQAIMELGALVCKPVNPLCNACPISEHCISFQHKTSNQFPVKTKKIKASNRYLHLIVPIFEDRTYLIKREEKDIWHGLYLFPLVETNLATDEQKFPELIESVGISHSYEVLNIQPVLHKLTHQNLFVTFYLIKLNHSASFKNNDIFEVKLKQINNEFPFPRLITRYLEQKTIRSFFDAVLVK